jgi:glycerol-3-phosphate dehydrogenase
VLPLGGDTTASSRREHMVRTGRFGMVSIAGGKLTTHRRIALEALRCLPEPRLSNLRLVNEPLARPKLRLLNPATEATSIPMSSGM